MNKLIVSLLAIAAMSAFALTGHAGGAGDTAVKILYGDSGVYVNNLSKSPVYIEMGKEVWIDDLSGPRHREVIPLGALQAIQPGHGLRIVTAGFRNGETMVLTARGGSIRTVTSKFHVWYSNGRPWVKKWDLHGIKAAARR